MNACPNTATMLTVLLVLTLVLANCSCQSFSLFADLQDPNFSLFGDVQESPLMESSLEQTLDEPEPTPPISPNDPTWSDDGGPECPENCACGQSTESSDPSSQEEPVVRIYDLLQKILQVFDAQAHRNSDRARRLLDLRLLSTGQSSGCATNNDDDSLNLSTSE
ncbi:uncharacterized protein LOC129729723 isoform X2 [Wyeomyia smithii]|uniref:uncharacterized protein LOC129729723 isoform X2 n=1 Tax=Wyeomyia smithii TaxID=174621 RepID=UPI002467C58B|nr:uncharacterized protein LOC129729723 isoform X2 [Wyeomyia smithii]